MSWWPWSKAYPRLVHVLLEMSDLLAHPLELTLRLRPRQRVVEEPEEVLEVAPVAVDAADVFQLPAHVLRRPGEGEFRRDEAVHRPVVRREPEGLSFVAGQ